MKILVTGGSGFIGSHIVDKLISSGYKVRILDLKPPVQKSRVDFIKGDFMKDSVIKKAFDGIDVVYHIGGFSNIDYVKGDPIKTVELNILGTAKLLDASRKRNIKRFIFASSIYVNDNKGHIYTTSKICSEMLCRDFYTLYGLPYTILRYGTVYGERSRMADVVSCFVKTAIDKKKILIYGTGKQTRNFVFAEDVGIASAKALKDAAKNKIYTVADEKATSINDLAFIVKRKLMHIPKIIKIKSKTREDDYTGKADDSLAPNIFKALDIKQKYDLEKGVEKFINWYKKNN